MFMTFDDVTAIGMTILLNASQTSHFLQRLRMWRGAFVTGVHHAKVAVKKCHARHRSGPDEGTFASYRFRRKCKPRRVIFGSQICSQKKDIQGASKLLTHCRHFYFLHIEGSRHGGCRGSGIWSGALSCHS